MITGVRRWNPFSPSDSLTTFFSYNLLVEKRHLSLPTHIPAPPEQQPSIRLLRRSNNVPSSYSARNNNVQSGYCAIGATGASYPPLPALPEQQPLIGLLRLGRATASNPVTPKEQQRTIELFRRNNSVKSGYSEGTTASNPVIPPLAEQQPSIRLLRHWRNRSVISASSAIGATAANNWATPTCRSKQLHHQFIREVGVRSASSPEPFG